MPCTPTLYGRWAQQKSNLISFFIIIIIIIIAEI